MADDLLIDLSSKPTITISQDTSFEDFVAQFQTSCSKLLCIVNGKQLHYYDKKGQLPIGLRFEYKRKHKGRTAYYFNDISNNTYCVFGREVALFFYDRLDEIDPNTSEVSNIIKPISHKNKAIVMPISNNTNNVINNATTRIIKSKCPTEIVIIDCGQRHSFPYINYNVDIITHEL